jgi:hypothetical protein
MTGDRPRSCLGGVAHGTETEVQQEQNGQHAWGRPREKRPRHLPGHGRSSLTTVAARCCATLTLGTFCFLQYWGLNSGP